MRTTTVGQSALFVASHLLSCNGFTSIFTSNRPTGDFTRAFVSDDVILSPSALNVGNVVSDVSTQTDDAAQTRESSTVISTSKKANVTNQSVDNDSISMINTGKGNSSSQESKLKPLKLLSLGDEIDGTIEQITPIGVFVKIGYATKTYGTALIHKSQVSNFTAVKQTWTVGKKLTSLRVTNIDTDEKVVGLSTFTKNSADKAAKSNKRPPKKRKSISKLKLGQEIQGRVKKITDFGAFFDIGYQRDALVHISKITKAKVRNIEDFLTVGHMEKIRIISIDLKRKTVGASMLKEEIEDLMEKAKKFQKNKRITVTGWVETLKPLTALKLGAEVDGQVSRITPYGAFVRIGYQTNIQGGCGLLHKSQIQDELVGDVHDVLKRGQSIKARVTKIDYQKRNVSLSMRSRRSKRISLARLEIGQEMEGTVKSLTDYGAFVDIGHTNDALVHISRIAMSKIHDINEYLEVGQKVQVRIIGLDLVKKRIAASMLEKEADIYLDRRKKNLSLRFEKVADTTIQKD